MRVSQNTINVSRKSWSAKFINFLSSSFFLKLTFAWFVFQTLFMSLSTRLGVSPDETYHYGFARLLEKNGWLPFIHNQYGQYSLGEVKHTPFFLYHYLMSLPLHIIGSWHAVEILRLINIALAVWSLILIIKLARRLKVSPLVTNLSLFMLANTLMFVFLSSAINYDNLLIPLSLLSFILLFDFLDKPDLPSFVKLLAVCLAGAMTAINFLPILAAIVLVVLYKFTKHPSLLRMFTDTAAFRGLNKLLLAAVIILSLLFLQRYGVNAVRYHAINPSCLRFSSYQQCSQDGIFNRPQTFPVIPNHPRPTPFEYFTDWGWSMRARTFGILGHESISDNKVIRFWSEILLFGGALAVIRYYRPTRNWNIIIGFGLFYGLVLFLRNWSGYYHSGYNFGLQGRYMFIFLPFVYILFNRYILEALRHKPAQMIYIVITLVVFAVSSLPTYTLKTDPTWYKNSAATRTNNDIRKFELKIKGSF